MYYWLRKVRFWELIFYLKIDVLKKKERARERRLYPQPQNETNKYLKKITLKRHPLFSLCRHLCPKSKSAYILCVFFCIFFSGKLVLEIFSFLANCSTNKNNIAVTTYYL